MDVLKQVLDFANSVTGKTLLLYGFGWLLKASPKVANEVIPVANLVVNILVTVVASAVDAGGIKPALMVAAVQPQHVGVDWLVDVVAPQLLADGLYNWPRRVYNWIFVHKGKTVPK